MKNKNFRQLIQEFLEYLEIEKGRSIKTLTNYRHYLERFLQWLQDVLHQSPESVRVEEMNPEQIRKYRLFLNRLKGKGENETLKRNTQNYHLIAIRSFVAYLARRDILVLSPEKIELAKQPSRDIAFLTSEEVNRLLKAPEGSPMRACRDRALLETLFSSGVRVSELCSLDRDEIDWVRGELTVRGKGDKFRVVFLSPSAKEAIKAYLALRKDVDPALFIRIPGREKFEKYTVLRLTPRSVQRIIKYYTAKAGIMKRVTPHTLRHSYATDLLRAGADIRSVQAMLGHSSITTTQIYTHITDKDLREIHHRFHRKQQN